MDLVGGLVGRRLRAKRPAIIFVAIGPRPHSGVVGGKAALKPELGDLAGQRRRDLLLGDGASALGPIARDVFLARAARDRFDQAAAAARARG